MPGRLRATPGPRISLSRKRLVLIGAPFGVMSLALVVGLVVRAMAPSDVAQTKLPTASAVALVADRTAAPDFSVTTTGGSLYRLSERTGKVRVLFFTAPG